MKKIDNLTLGETATIKEALSVIDRGAMRLALVIDSEGILKGSLSDGDLRRALLNGASLEQKITGFYNQNPFFVNDKTARNEIVKKALEKKIYQVPVVDLSHKLIGIYEIDELLAVKKRSNMVLLMAGGMGVRLGELTKETPKPMLHVGPKPILQTIIEGFVKSGFTEIVICVNYLSDKIKHYFGDGRHLGANITYQEEPKRMGTAGAIGLAALDLSEPFFVMNADILTNVDFSNLLDFHLSSNVTATMAIRQYEYQVPYGVVETVNSEIKSISEKPVSRFNVSAGIYVLSPEVIKFIPKDSYFDMPQLFNEILKSNLKANSFEINEYWVDVGRVSDYEQANSDYKKVF